MSSRYKICYVTSMHDWNDDRIFERAAWGLAQKGHEVTLIAPAERDFEVDGITVLSIRIRSRFQKHLKGPSDAFNRMKEVDADVYHFFNPNMMWVMRKWAKKGRLVFFDIHENYESRVDALPLPSFIRSFLVRRYRSIENRLCSSFAGLTVVTESMKQKVSSANVPTLIVGNVPFLKRLENVKLAEKKEDNPVIITSGTHSMARNCMSTVEALPLIEKEIPAIEMKFVGKFQPPSLEEALKKRAKELGVSDKLTTEGMLPWLENFKRVSKAHVGCVFYDDNLNNRVTLPNRLYEYMYCGLAVLGENFPEVKKVIEDADSGRVVNSSDPRDIAEKAIELLKNSAEISRCMQNAEKAIVNNHNFEKALEDLESFYSRALQS